MIRPSQAHISVITDAETLQKLQNLSDHIALFLVRKGQMEQRRQDLTNRTILGGVNFWFQIDDKNGSIILCYDKHPKDWKVDEIMRNINDLEHMFYVQEGMVFVDTRIGGN